MKLIVKLIFIASIVVFITSFFYKDDYPLDENIVDELQQAPVQTETEVEEFKVEKKDKIYTVTPKYDYELYGLVTSYHHSDSIIDYYHKQWGDDLNVKDICVLWGDNLQDQILQNFIFSSTDWTCNFKTLNDSAWEAFDQNQGSNNHLLVADENLKKEIKKAKKGDQIYFKGYLAKYSHDQGFERDTSTSREDTGNGACEVVYVTDFKILKKANELWNDIYWYSIIAFFGSIVLWFLIPLRVGHKSFKEEKKKKKHIPRA